MKETGETREVTQKTYCRAETDRTLYNASQLAGGVNSTFSFRNVTPLDRQTVVRMNKDTLYTVAVVDTSKGATITVPEMPAGRYFSVLLLDNDHYCPGVIYTSGTHELPQDTKYLAVNVRIQLFNPDDPAEIALVNKLQDQFVIKANSADPFPEPTWDKESLAALTAEYKKEFAKLDLYPDGWMGKRGEADEETRHIAAAGAWGLFPNEDAAYINYDGRLPADKCHTATYQVPENRLRRGWLHEEREQHSQRLEHEDECRRRVHRSFRVEGSLRRCAQPPGCPGGLELPYARLPARPIRSGWQLQTAECRPLQVG
jgi:hypothetical protein